MRNRRLGSRVFHGYHNIKVHTAKAVRRNDALTAADWDILRKSRSADWAHFRKWLGIWLGTLFLGLCVAGLVSRILDWFLQP